MKHNKMNKKNKEQYYIKNNVLIHNSSIIIGKVSINKFSSIWPSAILRGDSGTINIGSYTSIQDGTICHMTKNISNIYIGNYVTIGHKSILHGCTINNNCIIGMGSILLDNCVIGENSIIAAGSIITTNTIIPMNSFVLGIPGKIIRFINTNELSNIQSNWLIYKKYVKEYISK